MCSVFCCRQFALKHKGLCCVRAASGLSRVVWWLKYSLGMSAGSLVSTPTPISSSSHHTTTGLVTRGEKAAPAFHCLCHHSHYCTQAFSQDIQHPGKWGILLRIPLSSLREPKQGWKSLLGAFQRGWSPDTAALCTSKAGQRPLSWTLHILVLTGLLCSCQPEQHNTQCAYGRPLPSHFPTERSERTPLTNHSAAAGGSSPL